MAGPPPLPDAAWEARLRRASLLNALLPGAGLICLGRWIAGTILLGLGVISAVGVLVVLFRGYFRYLDAALSGRVLAPGELERMGREFAPAWLAGLMVLGIVAALVSWVWFGILRRQLKKGGGGQ